MVLCRSILDGGPRAYYGRGVLRATNRGPIASMSGNSEHLCDLGPDNPAVGRAQPLGGTDRHARLSGWSAPSRPPRRSSGTWRATPSAGLHPGRAAPGSDGNKEVNKPGPAPAGRFHSTRGRKAMDEGSYLMGVDYGTGGVRVGLFDHEGTPVVFHAVGFETSHPRPGWA